LQSSPQPPPNSPLSLWRCVIHQRMISLSCFLLLCVVQGWQLRDLKKQLLTFGIVIGVSCLAEQFRKISLFRQGRRGKKKDEEAANAR
jgi:hypothetical protein